ncbi:MAG: hypothetical protein ACFE9C_18595 [Candidatus Hodarchaeota archaeon]
MRYRPETAFSALTPQPGSERIFEAVTTLVVWYRMWSRSGQG